MPQLSALPDDLSVILAHLESTYPLEGCGVVFRSADHSFRVCPLDNVYDKYHRQDAEAFPRTSATAYLIDPIQFQKASQQALQDGYLLSCIFHSHIAVGSYFSDEDQAMAAPGQMPLFPEVSYLVVGVSRGQSTEAKLFWWENGTFLETGVPLLSGS